ncbi:2-oxo-4-hydroxy-4-carboxy-5-ureidoimidazoline decarboxylase [Nocardia wallacei]|uniref:2-oxo-4-hydroxy-4-carboxy-5-ureidoimidazoline decarboxylase n=1 Tax=Nocardia wallacei TaxID=480035 RepID=UPI0024538B6D|nr:2-oxo-4-hydroxy-4-carboxy-5-ureidoimidazoline decarboxylase [Nocardia wallacei]
MTVAEDDLDTLDTMPEPEAVRLLLTCCASPEWARTVAAGRPFGTVTALLAAADDAVAGLSEEELDLALSGHPRIGDRPDSPDSAREQAAVVTAGDAIRAELADRNREYEQRFGHVYLVCATGRSAPELLDILVSRLNNDPRTERGIVREELGKINRIRLRRLVREIGQRA